MRRGLRPAGVRWAALVLGLALPASSGTYYVAPGGSGDGSSGSPWGVVQANAQAQPGDVVYFRAGTYTDWLRPLQSGAPGAPIVFAKDPADGSGDAVFAPPAQLACFHLADRSYLHLVDLRCDGAGTAVENALNMPRTDHLRIERCTLENASEKGVAGAQVTESVLLDNVIRNIGQNGSNVGEGMRLYSGSSHNLIQGNQVENAGHNAFQLYGDSHHNVIRGNTFRNPWTRVGAISGPGSVRNVIEDNVIADAAVGEVPIPNDVPWKAWKVDSPESILRRNRVFHNACRGLESAAKPEPEQLDVSSNRIYHNVVHASGLAGYSIFDTDASVATDDLRLVNNVFLANHDETVRNANCPAAEPGDATVQIRFDLMQGGVDGARVIANGLRDSGAGQEVVEIDGIRHTIASVESAFPALFAGNFDDDPQFVDAAGGDFHPRTGSPLVDRGAFLAATTASGTLTDLVPVTDALPFVGRDDYLLAEVGGDVIRFRNGPTTTVLSVVDANTLRVDPPVTFTAGQELHLDYKGAGPDVGVYETTPPKRCGLLGAEALLALVLLRARRSARRGR